MIIGSLKVQKIHWQEALIVSYIKRSWIDKNTSGGDLDNIEAKQAMESGNLKLIYTVLNVQSVVLNNADI